MVAIQTFNGLLTLVRVAGVVILSGLLEVTAVVDPPPEWATHPTNANATNKAKTKKMVYIK